MRTEEGVVSETFHYFLLFRTEGRVEAISKLYSAMLLYILPCVWNNDTLPDNEINADKHWKQRPLLRDAFPFQNR